MGISQFTGVKNNFVTKDLSDQIDGNTINFVTIPFVIESLMVFYNGIRQSNIEITITSNSSFSTSFVPSVSESLTVTFFKL